MTKEQLKQLKDQIKAQVAVVLAAKKQVVVTTKATNIALRDFEKATKILNKLKSKLAS